MTLSDARKFSIAPMMDWTDRHCRYLHRLLTKRALLFTEMVTSPAIVHGDQQRLLGYDQVEHPVAVQLGGSDPIELAEAARICVDFGYDEINLNVGCPSDRVKSGRFGACLMAEPHLVAECVAAMKAAVEIPVTVKCRIGIDDQDVEIALDTLVDAVLSAGAGHIYVHARKAWLQGLSPKENRDIPPLDYDRVYRLATRLGKDMVSINGGITSLAETHEHLTHVAGVMMGRAAYQDPVLLREVDSQLFNDPRPATDLEEIMHLMADYAARHLAQGGRLNHVTRHMLGLANGRPGARKFRQILSNEACVLGADERVVLNALDVIQSVPA